MGVWGLGFGVILWHIGCFLSLFHYPNMALRYPMLTLGPGVEFWVRDLGFEV